MKSDREFTGRLLGFDDFVSELLLTGTVNLVKRLVTPRHGAGRRHGIVRGFLGKEERPLNLDSFQRDDPAGPEEDTACADAAQR